MKLGLLAMAQASCRAICLRPGVVRLFTESVMSVSGIGVGVEAALYRQADACAGGR